MVRFLILTLLFITFNLYSTLKVTSQEEIDKIYDELKLMDDLYLEDILYGCYDNYGKYDNYDSKITFAIEILTQREYSEFDEIIDYLVENFQKNNSSFWKRYLPNLLGSLVCTPIHNKYKDDNIKYYFELQKAKEKYKYIEDKGINILYFDNVDYDSFTDDNFRKIGYTEDKIKEFRISQSFKFRLDSIKKLPDNEYPEAWFRYNYDKKKRALENYPQKTYWVGNLDDREFHTKGLDHKYCILQSIKRNKETEPDFANFLQECYDNIEISNRKVQEEHKKIEAELKPKMEEYLKTVSKPYNHNPVLNEPKKSRFTRPEDRGVSFKDTTQSVLIERLKNSADKVELRKVTQVLGNREIAGKIGLSDEEKKVVYDATVRFLNYQDSSKVDTREEGRFYIHRLWRLAVPALLHNLHNENIRKKELAAKCLLFMKNEEIVQKIIELADKEKDPVMKKKLIFVLNKVDKVVTTIVPDRKSIDEAESKALFDKLVKPALIRLENKRE